MRLWAHGDHPSASALAMTLGFERWRVLWQMRRSLLSPVPEPVFPDGVSLRPFVPGADDAAWVAVNAAAFADLPDQGGWTLDDLRLRMKEPWFDPAGFLLARRDADGSCSASTGRRSTAGRRPATAGSRTTRSARCTCSASRRRRTAWGWVPRSPWPGCGTCGAQGLGQAMLYVDESNAARGRLYGKLGFARWSTDVGYRRRI